MPNSSQVPARAAQKPQAVSTPPAQLLPQWIARKLMLTAVALVIAITLLLLFPASVHAELFL
ncbi:MAG: hypothetical protein AAGF66_14270 [Cyanobacteria bacterium P01_H01_bin.119]